MVTNTTCTVYIDNVTNVNNGTFETGDFTGWDDYGGIGGGTCEISTDAASSGTYGCILEIDNGEPAASPYDPPSMAAIVQDITDLSTISSIGVDIKLNDVSFGVGQGIRVEAIIMEDAGYVPTYIFAHEYNSSSTLPLTWSTKELTDINLTGSGFLGVQISVIESDTDFSNEPECEYSGLADHPTNGGFELGDFTEWNISYFRHTTDGASSGVLAEAASSGTYGALLYAEAPQRVFYSNSAQLQYTFTEEEGTELQESDFCKMKLRINVPHLDAATNGCYNRVLIGFTYNSGVLT